MAAILEVFFFFCLQISPPCLIQGKIFFWISSLRKRQQGIIWRKTTEHHNGGHFGVRCKTDSNKYCYWFHVNEIIHHLFCSSPYGKYIFSCFFSWKKTLREIPILLFFVLTEKALFGWIWVLHVCHLWQVPWHFGHQSSYSMQVKLKDLVMQLNQSKQCNVLSII